MCVKEWPFSITWAWTRFKYLSTLWVLSIWLSLNTQPAAEGTSDLLKHCPLSQTEWHQRCKYRLLFMCVYVCVCMGVCICIHLMFRFLWDLFSQHLHRSCLWVHLWQMHVQQYLRKLCLTYINVCGCFFNLEALLCTRGWFSTIFSTTTNCSALDSVFVHSKIPCVRVCQRNKEDLEAKKREKSR